MKNLIFLTAVAILVTGCAKRRIDSSTDEKFKTSIEAIEKSLSPEKRKEFEEAVQAMALSEIGNLLELAANPDGVQRRVKDRLNRKTADEIIAEGNRLIAERKAEEREQAIGEIRETETRIAELKQKRADAENAKENLKQFNVVRSLFYFEKDSFIERPTIELTLENKTKFAVSKAYFDGVLSSLGRSVPWVVGSFNWEISGGIEPGEQGTWKLFANMFGEWSKAPKDRNDMVLTVMVTRIDGPDGKPLYDSGFSESDKEELKGLNERLTELQKAIQK